MSAFELKTANGIGEQEEYRKTKLQDVTLPVTQRTWFHYLIGPVTFLYFTGMNMSLFVTVQYIYRRLQVQEYPNKTFVTGYSYCDINQSSPDAEKLGHVQEVASEYNIVFNAVAGIPSICINIVFGSMTDRFGRKFMIITAMTGTLLRVVVCAVGVHYIMSLPLFAIAFLMEGLTGQIFGMLLASYSYVSDITTRKSRPIGIVLLEVSIGLGTSIPTFAAGYYLQEFGFLSPLISSAVVIAIAILIAIFLLPESFPEDKRVKTSEKCINLRNAVGFYFSKSNAGRRWKYIVAIVVFFLTMIDVTGRNSVEVLYQMNTPFCWIPQKLGWFGALRSGLQQVVGLLLAVVLKQFMADNSVAIVGSVSFAGAFLLEGLAVNDVMIYMVTVVGAGGMLTVPMMRSILSRWTPADKQGAVTASIAAVEASCQLVSNVLMGAIYRGTVRKFAGAVFLVMGALNIVCLVLLFLLKCCASDEEEDGEQTVTVRPLSYIAKTDLDHSGTYRPP